MPESSDLYFVTRNKDKYNEAKSILSNQGIELKLAEHELVEIQSDDQETIALEKAKEACNRLNSRVIIEDDGLYIASLRGFPGPYSSYVFRTIGNEGIIELLKSRDERTATFRSVVAYCEPKNRPISFVANVNGEIAPEPRGNGWGYDPIFIPSESGGRTYAELRGDKNEYSHRRSALDKLAVWMKNYRKA